jgi:SAM-dependent methyltransferase
VSSRLYRILEVPLVYRLSQALLAPGQNRGMDRQISAILASLPATGRILDLGCGPSSWLSRHGLEPVGLDLSPAYVRELAKGGTCGVVASAGALPFRADSFDGVWSIGLFHHLPDEVVVRTMEECARVCRADGHLSFLDAVLPRQPWRRPLAHWIRRADRGRFVRSEEHFRRLLLPGFRWSVERHTYTLTGMELVACVCRFERD